jgi:3-oxoacyl-[acyl-carrier-protein] synthase-3
MNATRFESLGAYLPPQIVSTQELINKMQFTPRFSLERITGIKNRRVCEGEEDSFVLALEASRDCLSRSRYRAEDLEVIISTSITRLKDRTHHYWEPSFALLLAKELGADTAIHFDLSNACAGMMSGILVLDRMIRAGTVKTGMVVSGEYITPAALTAVAEMKHTLDHQFASLTVGDAGAAVILDASLNEDDLIHYIEMTTCSEYSHLCLGQPSDQGGGPALYTQSHEMQKEDRIQLWPRFQSQLLAQRGTDFAQEQYDYLIHHQISDRAIQKFSRHGQSLFKTPMPESLSILAEHGNTASTSHFLTLYQLLKTNRLNKRTKFLMVPAASGVVTGCLSVTISSLKIGSQEP